MIPIYTKSDFISAEKLKHFFSITGFYYFSTKHIKYRKFLNIKLNTTTHLKKPDLMVIMMNPGSSKPSNNSGESYNNEIPAKPDPTQYKIMRFMLKCNYKYARILNLSDLIQPTSSIFYNSISVVPEDNVNSIFHPNNIEELNKLFEKNTPTLIAWGVNDHIQPLIDLTYKYVTSKSNFYFGINKPNTKDRFYHPQTRDKGEYARWINGVLKSHQNKKRTL